MTNIDLQALCNEHDLAGFSFWLKGDKWLVSARGASEEIGWCYAEAETIEAGIELVIAEWNLKNEVIEMDLL